MDGGGVEGKGVSQEVHSKSPLCSVRLCESSCVDNKLDALHVDADTYVAVRVLSQLSSHNPATPLPTTSNMSRRMSLTKTISSRLGFSAADADSSDEKKDEASSSPSFLSSSLGPRIAAIIESNATNIRDDSFLKIVRQLEHWHTSGSLNEEEFLALAERLTKIASWRAIVDDESVAEEDKFKIPKVRFGRTEVMMPIVTCGGTYC